MRPAAPGPLSTRDDPSTLFDPVSAAAPVARRLAADLCQPIDGGPPCSWYHGMWPYLRLLGAVASPERHEKFYFAALGALAGTGQYDRVLVSGTADHSMLAHLARAYRANGATPDVTVFDRCPTPIELCKWYGGQVSIDVGGVPGDILQGDAGGAPPFDAICTHSFLSQFSASQRPKLVERWHTLLRSGGKVVTTTRITPSVRAGDRMRFTPQQIEAFSRGIAHEAARREPALDIDAGVLLAGARRFAELTVGHPTPSVADVLTLFHRGGFRLERLDVRRVGGGIVRNDSGPGTSQPALYAEIVASRA